MVSTGNKTEQSFPLTFAQQAIYFDQLRNPDSPQYNVGGYIRLTDCQLANLSAAHQRLLTQHPAFHLKLLSQQGKVAQAFCNSSKIEQHRPLQTIDFSHDSELARQNSMAWVDRQFQTPFDLDDGTLYRGWALKISVSETWYVGLAHHLAVDGFGFRNWAEALCEIYNELLQVDADVRHELRDNTLATRALKEEQYLQSNTYQRDRIFWQNQFEQPNDSVLTPFYLDKSPPQGVARSQRGTTHLPRHMFDQLDAYAQQLQVSVAHVFMSIIATYFEKAYALDSITLGIPTHNRRTASEKAAIATFASVSPLRIPLDDTDTFSARVTKVKRLQQSAFRHQRYPISHIMQDLNKSHGDQELFDVVFNYLNFQGADLKFAHSEAELIYVSHQHQQTPLTINVWDGAGEAVELQFDYNQSFFTSDEIGLISKRIVHMLHELLSSEQTEIKSLSILPETEKQTLLTEFGQGKRVPLRNTVLDTLNTIVNTSPDAIAVSDDHEELSYLQLHQKSDALANYLLQNLTPPARVALCLPKSNQTLIAMLAVLKTGASLLTIDPGHPQARKRFICEDAGVKLILSETSVELPALFESQRLNLDQLNLSPPQQNQSPQSQSQKSHRPMANVQLVDEAYAVYTSGSTGQPKASSISHGALANLAHAQAREFNVDQNSRVLQFASLSFDASISEIFVTLCAGATLVLLADEARSDIDLLERTVLHKTISHATLPPALLYVLTPEHWHGVTTLVLAGEKCPQQVVQKWGRNRHLINAYGPSETCVCATVYHYQQNDDAFPIGNPIENVDLYVVNSQGQLCPTGIPGELLIGGAGVAKGYINRHALTAEKFVNNPFNPADTSKLYRTGDLVRWLPNGNLAFIARTDTQIKIRGFRVETKEIEHHLEQVEEVNHVFVTAMADEQEKETLQEKLTLLAYIVTNVADEDARQELQRNLRERLKANLPDYMVPAYFVFLDNMPLNRNGKIDQSALPQPNKSNAESHYVAPVTDNEKLLCDVWRTILGKNNLLNKNKVGVSSNFFEMGGHSLQVMEMQALLEKQGKFIRANQIFRTPTIKQLAPVLQEVAHRDINIDTSAPAHPAIPHNCEQITPAMLPLLSLTQAEIDQFIANLPWPTENIQDIYPLGPIQEGILYHHLLDAENDLFVLPAIFKVSNQTELESLLDNLQEVVARHDILRTLFVYKELEQPLQVVLREYTIPVHELTGMDSQQYTPEEVFQEAAQDIKFEQAPPLQCHYYQDTQNNCLFLRVTLHHIMADHVTLEMIQQELNALQQGTPLANNPRQFKEFVSDVIQQDQGASGQQHVSREHFNQELGDFTSPSLPYSLTTVIPAEFLLSKTQQVLPEKLTDNIRATCHSQGISISSFFHLAWAMVVGHCSSQTDVVFGTVLSGRLGQSRSFTDVMGPFINTLPVRLKLATGNAAQALAAMQQKLSALLDMEATPLTVAQNAAGIRKDIPLFSALINYRHTSQGYYENIYGDIDGGGGAAQLVSAVEKYNYPFVLSVDDFGDQFMLDLQVEQIADAQNIYACMQDALSNLVSAISTDATQSLAAIGILSAPKKQALMQRWQARHLFANGDNELITAKLAYFANTTPNAPAVAFNQMSLSYAQLRARVDHVAHYLYVEHQVQSGSLVGIYVQRSERMLMALLAILRLGASYVPLDPEFPPGRLQHMVTDSGTTLTLTDRDTLEKYPLDLGTSTVAIDDVLSKRNASDTAAESVTSVLDALPFDAESPAYVIYTSGSTGKPKGVVISYAALANFLQSMQQEPGISASDTLVAVTTLSFDIAALELFLPIISGARLVIANNVQIHEPEALAHLLDEQNATLLQATPSRWRSLLEISWQGKSDLVALCGGEALKQDLASELLPKVNTLWNMYGPTETTIWSSTGQVTPQQATASQPIGAPIANTSLFILDDYHNLVTANVPGELYIAGDGVALGYFNRESLTREKFVKLPELAAGPIFKTGDVAKYDQQGNIFILGRKDNQVKVRGYRIELSEVEFAISGHQEVQQTAVTTKISADGSHFIVAYVILRDALHGDADKEQREKIESRFLNQLNENLKSTLPDYMHPSSVVILRQFPLTPNGKIDIKGLPEPQSTGGQPQVAATTDTEKAVKLLWESVLQRNDLGIHDNFFDIGGHSVLATRLYVKLESEFNIKLSLKQILEHQTIHQIAKLIDEERTLNRLVQTTTSAETTDDDEEEVWEI